MKNNITKKDMEQFIISMFHSQAFNKLNVITDNEEIVGTFNTQSNEIDLFKIKCTFLSLKEDGVFKGYFAFGTHHIVELKSYREELI